MPIKTFGPGVLTSSDVNTYLMNQAVITCTSSTRPGSPNEGMTIYETDTNLLLTYSGSAWEVAVSPGKYVTYTPTLGGAGWTLGNGTVRGRYKRVGNAIIMWADVVWGSTSTFGTVEGLTVSLPATLVGSPSNVVPVGLGQAVDVSAGMSYQLTVLSAGNSACRVNCLQSAVGLVEAIINTKPFAWTAADYLRIIYIYEAE